MLQWLRSKIGLRSQTGEGSGFPKEVAEPTHLVGHIGSRRLTCFWEPIYSPDHSVALTVYDWDFARDAGPSNKFVSGTTLNDIVIPGDTFKVIDVKFKDCDFQGDFKPNSLLMFDECDFAGCDFAYSNWKGAHFRNCTFTDSSISLATFEGCEFRDCTWERVGFGSKSEFRHCFINNPRDLIDSSISKTNPKDSSFEHRLRQWYRLKGTRARVLRTLMISHQSVGDEHTYYEIVRLHELQCAVARLCENIYNFIFSKGQKISSFIAFPAIIYLRKQNGTATRFGTGRRSFQ